MSCEKRLPVRVVRGSKQDGKLQYVYDGLYMVKEFKMTVRDSGGMAQNQMPVRAFFMSQGEA